MRSAAVPPVPATEPDVYSTIALVDQDGTSMVAMPYRGDAALVAMLARWQGFASLIKGGSVFDQEGHTLARAQI